MQVLARIQARRQAWTEAIRDLVQLAQTSWSRQVGPESGADSGVDSGADSGTGSGTDSGTDSGEDNSTDKGADSSTGQQRPSTGASHDKEHWALLDPRGHCEQPRAGVGVPGAPQAGGDHDVHPQTGVGGRDKAHGGGAEDEALATMEDYKASAGRAEHEAVAMVEDHTFNIEDCLMP